MMSNSIELPIEARSIFRILAINKIVECPEFVAKLNAQFENIIQMIQPSSRLNLESKKRFPKHSPCNDTTSDIKTMPETNMCKSTAVFFSSFKITTGKNNQPYNVKMIDFQVPLALTRASGDGVIDMIGVSDPGIKSQKVYIIETKKWNSNEHPLRAMFEALTFWEMLKDKDGKFQSFIERYNEDYSMEENVFSKDATIVPVILIRKVDDRDFSDNPRRIYTKMMNKMAIGNEQELETYKQLYGQILKKGLLAWRYDEHPTIEDFTEEFRCRWGISK